MKLKIMAIVILSFLVLTIGAFANNEITVTVDGEKVDFDVSPQTINFRTMVPMRAIFEKLGAEVEYEEETRTVTARKKDTTISLIIGSKAMNVNEEVKIFDVPAVEIDGRTLVPVRAISEALGCVVNWHEDTSTVEILSKNSEKLPISYWGVEVLDGKFFPETGEKTFKRKNGVDVRANNKIRWDYGDKFDIVLSALLEHEVLEEDSEATFTIRASGSNGKEDYMEFSNDVVIPKASNQTKIELTVPFEPTMEYETEMDWWLQDGIREMKNVTIRYELYYSGRCLGETFIEFEYGFGREKEVAKTLGEVEMKTYGYNEAGQVIQSGTSFVKYSDLEYIGVSFALESDHEQYRNCRFPIEVELYENAREVIKFKFNYIPIIFDDAPDGTATAWVWWDGYSFKLNGTCEYVIKLFGKELARKRFTVKNP